MGRYPPGSKTSRHAGLRCCNRPHAETEPAAGDLGPHPLVDSTTAPGTTQTLPVRNRQPRLHRQPPFLKKSSHFSFVSLTANHNAVRDDEDSCQATIFRE